MSDEPVSVDAREPWQLEAAIALLAGSRWLSGLSFLLAGIAAFALAAADMRGAYARGAASAVLGLAVVSAYLALRSAMDRHFFRALAKESASLASALAAFDAALRSIGWVSEAEMGRQLHDRVAGVQRLVRALGIVLLVQVLLVAGVPWLR